MGRRCARLLVLHSPVSVQYKPLTRMHGLQRRCYLPPQSYGTALESQSLEGSTSGACPARILRYRPCQLHRMVARDDGPVSARYRRITPLITSKHRVGILFQEIVINLERGTLLTVSKSILPLMSDTCR